MTIHDSALLHNDCITLLKKSQQKSVDELMYKLFNCKENKEDFIELSLFIFSCYFEN